MRYSAAGLMDLFIFRPIRLLASNLIVSDLGASLCRLEDLYDYHFIQTPRAIYTHIRYYTNYQFSEIHILTNTKHQSL